MYLTNEFSNSCTDGRFGLLCSCYVQGNIDETMNGFSENIAVDRGYLPCRISIKIRHFHSITFELSPNYSFDPSNS